MLASFIFLVLGCVACGSGGTAANESPPQPPSQVLPTPPPIDSRPKVIAFGDSFTSGYGLDDWRKSYPSLLQGDVDGAGYDLQVINRGRPADTSTQGLARLDEALGTGDIRIFILSLGGNDVFRRVPIEETRASLDKIIKAANAKGAKVLLCGYLPADAANASTMAAMYRDLASEDHAALLPSLLEGVQEHSELLQPDGVHPNEAGARVVEQNVWKALQPLLKAEPRKKK